MLEIFVWIVAILFGIAFTIKSATIIWKIIYSLAPVVVFSVVLLALYFLWYMPQLS